MPSKVIIPDVYSVGVQDWDRKLFDALIPLPEGTSYNCYLVQGSTHIALIDTVDPEKTDELIDNLASLQVKKIDYIIVNHAEQDHSGSIPSILKQYPEAKIVTNQKCKTFLMDLLPLEDDQFQIVNDADILSLGNKTLKFLITPWVHWPETMLTYLQEDQLLFSCDLFGSHLATSDLFVADEAEVYIAGKRYYAEIMMPFRQRIKQYLTRLRDYPLKIIAPSHGPLYNNPSMIFDAYCDWTSDEVKKEVLLPYVSMHGSTEKMVEYLVEQLETRNIKVRPFNLIDGDIGILAMELVDAAIVVLATPTVLAGPHPAAVYAAYLMGVLRPKTKYLGLIGSYGWGGKTLEKVQGLLTSIKAEYLTPMISKGYPKQEEFSQLDKLADEIKSQLDKL